MRKKVLAVAVCLTMIAAMATGCGSSSSSSTATSGSKSSSSASSSSKSGTVDAKSIKVGVIYIGDENEGYTASHMNGIKEMKSELGLSDSQVIEKTTIPEDESCYDAAVDLADQGCNIIFGTSFGHESYILQAAQEFPDIQFCHATGVKAATANVANFHNYFDNIYEARYASGVVAGLKLQSMIDAGTITADQAKVGYVGAYPYAEVISGFTSFYLGIKSIVSSATMEVQYTNSWANSSLEAETATALISDGCVLIGQHADTTGSPSACETKGVPCVGYNVDMTSVAPDSALTSPTNNWGVYYTYAVKCVLNGESIKTDWSKGFADNAVKLTTLGKSCVEGTQAKVDETVSAIKGGTLHVFDTSKFTVNGSSLEDLIKSGGDYAKYSTYVSNGYFHESEVQSAPAFDLIIDGITVK